MRPACSLCCHGIETEEVFSTASLEEEAPPDQPLAEKLRLPSERMRQAFVRTRLLPDAPPPVSDDRCNPTHQAIPQAQGGDSQIRRLANLPWRGRNPRAHSRNAEPF